MRSLQDLQPGPAAAGWERRRRATEEALVSAGRALFTEKGFDATSVADIAMTAGVGLRTFYRYFPSKEWIACHSLFRFTVDGVEAVRQRPADEDPMDSLVEATYILETGGYVDALDLDFYLVETVPSVAGVQHHIVIAAQDDLTDLFAERLGVPSTALAARIPAAAATMAYQTATRVWWSLREAGELGSTSVWDLAREALRSVSP